MKLKYILFLLIGAGIFNSCGKFELPQKQTVAPAQKISSTPQKPTAYGAYLAGRVAHIRQDFNTAADYYVKSVENGASDPEITSRAYLLLATEGRIDESAAFAQKALQLGDQSNLIRFILMSEKMKNGNFAEARETLLQIKEPNYRENIIPLFEAWTWVGENNKEQALKTLQALLKDPSLHSLYYIHTAMINDFFDDKNAAKAAYDKVTEDESLELSFRSLQLISNFYLRNDQKDDALKLVKKYYNQKSSTQMIKALYEKLKESSPENTAKMIDSAQKGEGEAMFNIGTAFRGIQVDVSQIFNALALYLNPGHDVTRISTADLLEFNQRFPEAIQEYEKISPDSPLFYMAQMKIASIYLGQEMPRQALEKLKKINRKYPKNYHTLFQLGEASRMINRPDLAIKYYQSALKVIPEKESNWLIYYALGMAYERNNQWPKAEEVLQKALEKSNRNPVVLNYLGYTWLKHNQNSNEALYMIFEAYKQNPENGHIVDSLGWALYRMGKYEEAIKVLEHAADYLPSNAVVLDHLGDAYWQTGRKNEARFQWQHALMTKEDTEELNKEFIKRKIEKGTQTPATINFNEALLVERLKTLEMEQ